VGRSSTRNDLFCVEWETKSQSTHTEKHWTRVVLLGDRPFRDSWWDFNSWDLRSDLETYRWECSWQALAVQLSSLSPLLTPLLFHCRLKTYLFQQFFPAQTLFPPPGLTSLTTTDTAPFLLSFFVFFFVFSLLLACVVALYRAKAAYNHRKFPPVICWSLCLSVKCIAAKRLIGYGCGLGWSIGWVEGW